MNLQAIQTLFLKDLFLSRWPMFGYLLGGLLSVAILCLPGPTMGFIGFVLIVTVTIAAGIHLIGVLMLSEPIDMTRTFILSLPVSLLDYSIAKISVVLVTFLIPWFGMLALLTILTFVVPEANVGVLVPLVLMFLFLLVGFCFQLVVAVVTESVGWTIVTVVLGNISFTLFSKSMGEHPVISEIAKGDVLTWPPIALQALVIMAAVIVVTISFAFFWQSRSRDLV